MAGLIWTHADGTPCSIDHGEKTIEWRVCTAHGQDVHFVGAWDLGPREDVQVHSLNAAPDGITPDEWRRGIALIAASQLPPRVGTSTDSVIRDARKFTWWIKKGDDGE